MEGNAGSDRCTTYIDKMNVLECIKRTKGDPSDKDVATKLSGITKRLRLREI